MRDEHSQELSGPVYVSSDTVLAMALLGAKIAEEGELVWSGRMTARGLDFLEDWIQKNVATADHGGGHQRAKVLAQKCVNDAVGKGIPLEELETDERLSVTGIILDAMVHLAEPETQGN